MAGLQVLGATAGFTLLGIVAGVVVTRGLGPHDKGVFVYLATVVVGTVMQLTYGDRAAVARQWGRLRLPQREVFGAAILLGSAIYLAAAIALAAVAVTRPGQSVLWAAVLALPFTIVAQICGGFFLTEQRVKLVNIQTGIAQIALAAAAGVVYLFHYRLFAVVAVWVAGQGVLGLFSAAALARGCRLWPPATTRAILVEHVRFAAQACGTQLVAYLNARIDLVVVLVALGPAVLGVYAVAVGVNELLWMFTRALSIAAFGRITTGDIAESAQITARCVRHALLAAAVGGALIFVAAPLLTVVYGRAFADAVGVLRIVLPGAVVWSSVDILTVFFTTQFGRPLLILIFQGLSAAICATVTLAFAHRIGLYAGALGTSLAYSVSGLLAIVLFARVAKVSIGDVIVPRGDDLRAYLRLLRGCRVRHAPT